MPAPDVEMTSKLDITLIQRDQRARHESQHWGAAAQDQSYGHDCQILRMINPNHQVDHLATVEQQQTE
jgi:hypothetical protein